MRFTITAIVVPVVLSATLAHAQSRDAAAAAESLFRDAKAAEQRGDYKTACAQFAESQRLDAAAGTLLNQADCEEHLGAVASAWGHFVDARDQLAASDDRLPFAQQHIAALEKRLPHLVVRLPHGAPQGTTVVRGSVVMGSAALGVPLAVDPGPVTLTTTVPGHSPVATRVTMSEGQTEEVTLEVGGPELAPSRPTVTETSGHDSALVPGWIVGGVGVAGLLFGAVTGLVAMSDASTFKGNCNPSGLCQSQAGLDAASAGRTASTLSTVGFIGGAAVAGVGLFMVLLGSPSHSATRVGASALPGGASLSLTRGF